MSSTLKCWLFLWKWNIRKKSFYNIKIILLKIDLSTLHVLFICGHWSVHYRFIKFSIFYQFFSKYVFHLSLVSRFYVCSVLWNNFFPFKKFPFLPFLRPHSLSISLPNLYFPYLTFLCSTMWDILGKSDLPLINEQTERVGARKLWH